MSLLGFDALGRLAVGQIPGATSFVMIATPGAYIATGQAAAFQVRHASGVGSYAITGNATGFIGRLSAAAGSYALVGNDAALMLVAGLAAETGSFVVTGIDVSFTRGFENWIQRPFNTDTWTASTKTQEVWTPAANQSKTWTWKAPQARVFDPLIFDPDVFAVHGVFWLQTLKQSETWTNR